MTLTNLQISLTVKVVGVLLYCCKPAACTGRMLRILHTLSNGLKPIVYCA